MAITYKDAGVDVAAGNKAVSLMKRHAQSTFDDNVLTGLGSFGAMYDNGDSVLVSGTDGVGTKLKAAFVMDKHDTIGIDCVAMCANDIICHGAKPMFFLDYLATGKLDPLVAEKVVSGVANGCRQSGCSLVGGETAEMPGFYNEGEYDIAGFCVGSVDKDKLVTGHNIKAGDVLIGLGSSGIHSNGFSLVRAVVPMETSSLSQYVDAFGKTIGEEILTPTKIYVKTMLNLFDNFDIKGVAHMTGGGFFENIPRIFPKGIGAKIDLNSWDMPPIFDYLVKEAKLSTKEAYSTFNMGLGMILAVDRENANDVLFAARDLGENAFVIGETVKGSGVELCG
ncbi:MAG: phosphoribosylformylglycinamidine cyclo-ligase [Clostridia bacterium]|jgi:phosphoribosylformylglycinamidine cyclo-ligase|nr:phosphoribosylformylglycinamidine cyclo-ligase [Clostridia bacterium]